jgi:hypothetical protein
MAINQENFVAGTIENYDERLLERRLTMEGNVCGCLLKNLDLYEDCGLDVTDFITNNGRLLFLMAKKLREKGIQKFDEVTFVSSLDPDFVKMVENSLGDYNQVYNVMEAVNTKNWESFLDELNKNNIQLKLYKKGFNLFQKIEFDNGKTAVPFEYFKNLTSNEVIEFYEGIMTTMQTKVQNFKLVEEGYVDFSDTWLESLKKGEENGVSYGEAGKDINGETIRTFPFMSSNTLGLKPGTLSAWGAFSGTGKTTYMVTVAMSLISKGEKVVMVTNESRLSELNAIFLAWIIYRVFGYYKINKRKIITGRFTEEEYDICKKAQQYWRENYAKKIKIEVLSDADAKFSCQLIKRAILREGASVFIVDTMKMTLSDGPQDNSWIGLIKDVRSLTEIAMRYNVIGIFTLQLAMNASNKCWLDGSCLANCKQMKETLSNLILFRKLYGPELDPQSPYYIKPFRRKQNEETGEWYDEPYDADPTKQWIIAFSDKTRRGVDSGMDGTAFLCRTDLDHASFFETARCYPTRKLIGEGQR